MTDSRSSAPKTMDERNPAQFQFVDDGPDTSKGFTDDEVNAIMDQQRMPEVNKRDRAS